MGAPNTYQYQVGGSLASHAPTYIARAADASLYEKLLAGELCHIFNSRQMGKSSLLVQTKARLEKAGLVCISLDLTGIGGSSSKPEQWYKGVLLQLCMSCKILDRFNYKEWWIEQADLPFIQRLKNFITLVLFKHFPEQSIVVLIDEIDAVLNLPFSVDEFFGFIRFCFNQRSQDQQYQRITFGLFGVANPSTLIQNPHITPFNIGHAIELEGFSADQILPLSQGLDLPPQEALTLLHHILEWTSGQPFLTQKLAKLLKEHLAAPTHQKQATAQPKALVDQLIRSQIIQDWEAQDQPEHLTTIGKRLLYDESMVGRLLGIYLSILKGQHIHYDHSPEQIELLLSGLVVNHQGYLHVKNRIYQAIFSLDWTHKKLEKLRPYSQWFNDWIASGEADKRCLLQGMTLEKALAWSQDKQLSDLDYRFLGASQALAKQSAETELAVEKQERELAEFTVRSLQNATQVFSDAREKAKNHAQTLRLGRWWMAGVSASVTGGVLLLRLTGLLQGLEWGLLDQYFQRRVSKTLDPRITLITIDEPDIQASGVYPLPDQVLAQAITTLNQHRPRAIGLDIYRDLPVEPGHAAFQQVLQQSPHVVAIEKVISPPIPPPASLQPDSQVGFVDQIVDGDGTIRRGLLSISRLNGEGLHLSLPLQLSLKYLAAEGIEPQFLDHHQIRLGQSTLRPFTPLESGFYINAEAAGYQLLINYHGPQSSFQSLPLTQLLNQQFDPALIRDRVIIIGFTAESINDLFPSPYSRRMRGNAEPMAGITVHANAVSQLLSAALEQRPLLQVWPPIFQGVWIFLSALLGTLIAWQIRPIQGKLLAIALSISLLLGSTFFAFIQGWWLPIVPPLLALLMAAIVLSAITIKQAELWQLKQLTFLLHKAEQQTPIIGKISIEYLKQIEGQDPGKAQQIERWLQQAEQLKPMEK